MFRVVCAGLVVLGSGTAHAQVLLDYETDTFCQNQSALSVHGQAAFVGSGPCKARLVYATDNVEGSMWSGANTLVVSANTRVESRFALSINGGTSTPASGMTFVIRDVTSSVLGACCFELGYGGITNSVAVEFDTFESNSPNDPNDNHIGIDTNGSVTSVVTSTALPGNLDSGVPYYVWVVHDQAVGVLEVFMDAVPVQPASPLLTYPVNLPVGSTVTFGFTASTGNGVYDNYDVLSWHLYADNDTDLDGVYDLYDACPGFDDAVDGDGDGVADGCDVCPGADDALDTDGDAVPDCLDPCPLDNPDDSDADTVCDSDDLCPGQDDRLDTDGDTAPDCVDPCPLDPLDDSDGDGVCDSVDVCPGADDTLDTDGDGARDCQDPCPLDALDDSDGDGVCDTDDRCPGQDDNLDADGDGSPACEDCDDGNSAVYPGAPGEVPADGIDTDCDGLELCFEDADGDGFGSDAVVAVDAFDCLGPDLANNDDDCDDLDPDVYPGAYDAPGNGVDEDCDGFDGSVANGDTGLVPLVDGRPLQDPNAEGMEAVPVGSGCDCGTSPTGPGGWAGWLMVLAGACATRRRGGPSVP